MGGRDIAVDKPSIRKSPQPDAESLAFEHHDDRQKKYGPHQPRRVHCGAMSQQRDDSASQSLPQKLVQLVGCRDPKAGSDLKAGSPEAGSHEAGRRKATPPKAGSQAGSQNSTTQLKR
jgi:hypothetical protein